MLSSTLRNRTTMKNKIHSDPVQRAHCSSLKFSFFWVAFSNLWAYESLKSLLKMQMLWAVSQTFWFGRTKWNSTISTSKNYPGNSDGGWFNIQKLPLKRLLKDRSILAVCQFTSFLFQEDTTTGPAWDGLMDLGTQRNVHPSLFYKLLLPFYQCTFMLALLSQELQI